MINIAGQSVANIAATHFETVPVLEKYQLDFCCRGKRPLEEACLEKGLDPHTVKAELEAVIAARQAGTTDFSTMTASELIDHILIKHHYYVKQHMPMIHQHLLTIVTKHGSNFPYMKEVLDLFATIREEMDLHMLKEEQVLFPRIKEIETAATSGLKHKFNPDYINAPVNVMETDHEATGDMMARIKQLTNNYIAEENTCTIFRIALQELKVFEEDLHKHVHLENNILFPMASKLLLQANGDQQVAAYADAIQN